MARVDSPKRAWEEVWERSITLELRAEFDGVIASKVRAHGGFACVQQVCAALLSYRKTCVMHVYMGLQGVF